MTRKFSWETLDLFTKLAGVQAEFENYVDINKTNTGATLAVKDSYLRAQVEYYDIVVAVEMEKTGMRAAMKRIKVWPGMTSELQNTMEAGRCTDGESLSIT